MPNVYVEAVPKAVPREAPLETLWLRITPTTCSAPSRRRKRRSIGPGRTAIRPLSRAYGISTTRKSPTIGAPPNRRQHSIVNRVACNQMPFANSTSISWNRFTLKPFLWGET